MKDNFNVSIVDISGTYRQVADRARTTIGMEAGDKEVSEAYMRKMYLCEHSPIRIRTFIIRMENIPSWLATHFARHHVGSTPFISTQRDDRNKAITDRDKEPQGNLVTMELFINSQGLIDMAQKRLCYCAHPRAVRLMNEIKKKIREVDRPLAAAMVPSCIYRGWCYEHKVCEHKYHLRPQFEEQLRLYREGINNGK